jgi:hypothetical protein
VAKQRVSYQQYLSFKYEGKDTTHLYAHFKPEHSKTQVQLNLEAHTEWVDKIKRSLQMKRFNISESDSRVHRCNQCQSENTKMSVAELMPALLQRERK